MRWLAVLGMCALLALGGCGGGDDSPSTSSTGETTTAITPPSEQGTSSSPQGEKKDKQDQGKTSGSSAKSEGSRQQGNGSEQSNDSSSSPQRTKVPRISSAPTAGSKSPAPGVKTVKDGDNSVQEYGVEAGSSERWEASIALQAYLNARADEDWGSACSLLAEKPMEQLERLQKVTAKQGQKLNGCPATMALLREGEAQEEAGTKITEVLSFRGGGDISGDPSYLIYVAPPGNTLFSMPMYLQGGAWKVGLARAAELPVG